MERLPCMLNKYKEYILAISTLLMFTSACGGRATPAPSPSATLPMPTTAVDPSMPNFTLIDQGLKAALTGSIAYNAPRAMQLDETVTIKLLLNPTLEPAVLATQINEEGEVLTATIQITPRMKVVLIPQEADAFFVQPLHDNPEQLISTDDTTEWSWDVTAKKGGTHRLTLVIHRLITVEGTDSWRLVESYRTDIDVGITLAQRFLLLDWKWIVGILVTALLIPGFWRWYDLQKKGTGEGSKPKPQKKKTK
jgi:hypothetical protein